MPLPSGVEILRQARLESHPARFPGWYQTEVALPFKALARDEKLLETIFISADQAFNHNEQALERIKWGVEGKGDPNDWRLVRDNAVGIHYPPLATKNSTRHGTRERVLQVTKDYPDQLTVELKALATKVIFDDHNRAIGVEYLKGSEALPGPLTAERSAGRPPRGLRVARGDPRRRRLQHPAAAQAVRASARAPSSRSSASRCGSTCRGVGTNMQDRYEVGVVNRMNFPNWEVLKDRQVRARRSAIRNVGRGPRRGVHHQRRGDGGDPALGSRKGRCPTFSCFALLGLFQGYFPNYSALFAEHLNYLTWAILKAHTNNSAGTRDLAVGRSARRAADRFPLFCGRQRQKGQDLVSVVEGIKFVRKMTKPLIESGLIAEEELPGKDVQTDEQLADYVKYYAWGHHASCSCPIGERAKGGVVNGDFEVHGTQGLRIVDASVFPKIPGFFIVTSIYMIGEKAADVISKAAKP